MVVEVSSIGDCRPAGVNKLDAEAADVSIPVPSPGTAAAGGDAAAALLTATLYFVTLHAVRL